MCRKHVAELSADAQKFASALSMVGEGNPPGVREKDVLSMTVAIDMGNVRTMNYEMKIYWRENCLGHKAWRVGFQSEQFLRGASWLIRRGPRFSRNQNSWAFQHHHLLQATGSKKQRLRKKGYGEGQQATVVCDRLVQYEVGETRGAETKATRPMAESA